jgi:hypothetical protein
MVDAVSLFGKFFSGPSPRQAIPFFHILPFSCMNIRDALDAEHSKAQTLRITAFIGGSKKRFAELMAIMTGEDRRLAQRAAWVVNHTAEAQPEVVEPSIGELLANLQRPNLHDAIKRNTMKAMAGFELPEDLAGSAADIAFGFLNSPDEAVAVKVYSMSVLEGLCRREPALVPEVRLSIEHQLPLETKAAFHSRARHVLRALDRIEAV